MDLRNLFRSNLPLCGPSGSALPRLNFAKRGARGTDGPYIPAAHPSAKICEIYSVNSPRAWLEWVYDGQLMMRCTKVKTTLLKGQHVALAGMELLRSRGGPVTTHSLRGNTWLMGVGHGGWDVVWTRRRRLALLVVRTLGTPGVLLGFCRDARDAVGTL